MCHSAGKKEQDAAGTTDWKSAVQVPRATEVILLTSLSPHLPFPPARHIVF